MREQFEAEPRSRNGCATEAPPPPASSLSIGRLDPRGRLMLFAPHPDDESLPAAILLHRAIASGARVRVVYATDGERNRWPQRAWSRGWNLNTGQQLAWRARRRQEALQALGTLGIDSANARFLALPDQGLTRLLLERGAETARTLARTIEEWQPTHLVAPSPADTHPDHSALAILLDFAVASVRADTPATWTYLVHGSRQRFASTAMEIVGSADERLRKRDAIKCHKTQLSLSRGQWLPYADRPELFRPDTLETRRTEAGALRLAALREDALSLNVITAPYSFRRRTRALHVIAHDRASGLIPLELLVQPQRGIRKEYRGDQVVFSQQQRDQAMHYEIAIATDQFDLGKRIFAKLAGRSFDIYDDGWLELRAADTRRERGEESAAAQRMLA